MFIDPSDIRSPPALLVPGLYQQFSESETDRAAEFGVSLSIASYSGATTDWKTPLAGIAMAVSCDNSSAEGDLSGCK